MRVGTGLVGLLSITFGLGWGMELKAERSGGALCLVEWRSDRQHCRYRYVALTAAQCGLMFNPYPTAFPYGNGMVLHFYQQQESSTTKTVHKVINKGLKTYV